MNAYTAAPKLTQVVAASVTIPAASNTGVPIFVNTRGMTRLVVQAFNTAGTATASTDLLPLSQQALVNDTTQNQQVTLSPDVSSSSLVAGVSRVGYIYNVTGLPGVWITPRNQNATNQMDVTVIVSAG